MLSKFVPSVPDHFERFERIFDKRDFFQDFLPRIWESNAC